MRENVENKCHIAINGKAGKETKTTILQHTKMESIPTTTPENVSGRRAHTSDQLKSRLNDHETPESSA